MEFIYITVVRSSIYFGILPQVHYVASATKSIQTVASRNSQMIQDPMHLQVNYANLHRVIATFEQYLHLSECVFKLEISQLAGLVIRLECAGKRPTVLTCH